MSLDTVRVSQRAKDQLMRVKRDTGIKNWNVLCRWALCLSLAEKSIPAPARIVTDSSVEMKWETFGGEHADVYRALLIQRCLDDGLATDEDTLSEQLKLHLHRGIGYLFGDQRFKSIQGLLAPALNE
jgi:DNA sulfur modification protein DndE